ncbi:MAG: type II toxin-antitoxin system RelB/DinJ family antitoxin [Kiritimatiellia bacterium]
MTETLTSLPKTATFQFRINPKVRERVEAVYAGCGLTLTDAINIFIQQSINVEGLPFVVTRRSKAAKHEQAVTRLMSEIAAGEASAADEGWIDESAILSEFGG